MWVWTHHTSADTLEVSSVRKKSEIVSSPEKMDDAENYVKQNEIASLKQVSNFDFHVWTLGRKKDMKVKELVLETGTGKPKEDHKWEEEE